MTIQERRCPHCMVRQTFRLSGGRFFCANGKQKWPVEPKSEHRHMPPETQQRLFVEAVFTTTELARPRKYRAAIAHGLYTDTPVPPAHTTNRELPQCPTC